MRQSNDVDDAMNDAIMVVDHQQKRRLFLYEIHFLYIYLHFVLAGYYRCIRDAPSLQYIARAQIYLEPLAVVTIYVYIYTWSKYVGLELVM